MEAQTIAAIATAPGRSGIGVVRVSGKNLQPLIRELLPKPLTPRRARFCQFLSKDKSAIDEGIALYFPAPHSYTGEDVLELQSHGSPVVLRMLLARCVELGARVAQPGEFTQRAFLNDKLDLAQAEAVADLIEASTEKAVLCALHSLQGEFSQKINKLVQELMELRMLVEATLDFPEEEIDFLEKAQAQDRLEKLREEVTKIYSQSQQGALLREGLRVVLAGQPNVGKSSLLNRLAGQELAIVTPIAGTTRDAVREMIAIEGIPLHIIDTAGLRETQDQVESIGISRTWAEIEKADVVLLIVDAREGVTQKDKDILSRLPGRLIKVVAFNKIDLLEQNPHPIPSPVTMISPHLDHWRVTPAQAGVQSTGLDASVRWHDGTKQHEVYLSAKTGEGLDTLKKELLKIAGWQPEQEGIFMARTRHLQALKEAAEHLAQAEISPRSLELFAEELRLAQNALSQITGEFTADDLLGEIFSRFCIGK